MYRRSTPIARRTAGFLVLVCCTMAGTLACGTSTDELCESLDESNRFMFVPGSLGFDPAIYPALRRMADLAQDYDDPRVVSDGDRLHAVADAPRPDTRRGDIFAAENNIAETCS